MMIYECQVWPVVQEMLLKSLASETTAQAAPVTYLLTQSSNTNTCTLSYYCDSQVATV